MHLLIEDIPQISITINKDLNLLSLLNLVNSKPSLWTIQIGCKLKTTSHGPINLKRKNRIFSPRSIYLMFTMRLTCPSIHLMSIVPTIQFLLQIQNPWLSHIRQINLQTHNYGIEILIQSLYLVQMNSQQVIPRTLYALFKGVLPLSNKGLQVTKAVKISLKSQNLASQHKIPYLQSIALDRTNSQQATTQGLFDIQDPLTYSSQIQHKCLNQI